MAWLKLAKQAPGREPTMMIKMGVHSWAVLKTTPLVDDFMGYTLW